MMYAKEVKAIYDSTITARAEAVRTTATKFLEQVVFPQIVKHARNGFACKIISVPSDVRKAEVERQLKELGYEVSCETGKQLFIKWA